MSTQPPLRTVLVAAGHGDIETLERCFTEDAALVNAIGDNPYWGGRVQALHMAVIWGQVATVELLLNAGANPAGENAEYGGWSPLMLSARGGSEAINQLLRSAGAVVGPYEAAALGDVETVRADLRTEPTLPRQSTTDGTTLLHLAATLEIAQALLEGGAELEAVDDYGRRPLDTAIELSARSRDDGSSAVADHLITAGAAADAATFAALGDLGRFVAVIEETPDSIHWVGSNGSPPLHAAVSHGQLSVARWLIQNGADVNAPDARGVYPLHLTARAKRHDVEIAKELLAAGADAGIRDGAEDATPASWAEFQRRPALEELLRSALKSP